MPKLPNVLDYGAQVSLRSNRVDLPGNADLIKGEAVANAAGVVVDLITEKAQRDNRMEYALAKDELTRADIAEREALKDRNDWDAFDADYTAGYQERSDKIIAERSLTDTDRTLLQADSNLIRERGRVVAGDLSRTMRLDQRRAEVGQALIDGIEEVGLSPPEQQNVIMQNKLDMVRGAIDEGAYTEVEGTALLQKFVAAASTASLESMENEIALAEIDLSLAHRNARGAITQDEIFNDEGSGSIADFLPRHELIAMKKKLEDAIEIDDYQALGFDTSDEAWRLFDDPNEIKEREAYIRKTLKDHPKARAEALLRSGQRGERHRVADGLERQDTFHELTNAIRATDGMAPLDPTMLASLHYTEQKHLLDLQKQVAEKREWADSTAWDSREKWDTLSDAEKAEVDFNGTYEHELNDEAKTVVNIPWKSTVAADRGAFMSADRNRAKAAVAAGANARGESGMTALQILDNVLPNTPLFDHKPGNTKADSADRQRWGQIADAYNSAVIAEGDTGKLTAERKRAILTEVLVQHVFLDETGRDPNIPAIAVLPGEREDMYLPIGDPQTIGGRQIHAPSTMVSIPPDLGGGNMAPKTWIVNQYSMWNVDNAEPDEDELNHIWAILVTEDFYAAQARIIELATK
jgi:hypothetical protein